ncbi:hypothetical protein BJ878DRAFT_500826 [Calycina marina]|uniref:Uncharacterized protein n=1 Tax=Calycina marina TaxID=1763456 RepID=A0A9P8CHK4_9HELO|nr:hypothetical protein BJ878DRAFT_500826 [Calycina marina]
MERRLRAMEENLRCASPDNSTLTQGSYPPNKVKRDEMTSQRVDICMISATATSQFHLRRMADEQLSETKKYVVDNLHKDFIAPSNAPYSASILFAKKPDGGLRF